MALPDEQRLWIEANERGDSLDTPQVPDGIPGKGVPAEDKEPTDTPEETPDGDVAEPSLKEQRAAWLEAVDSQEIIAGGYSSTAYRRAAAVFDEDDNNVQLGEFWEYSHTDLDDYGRF